MIRYQHQRGDMGSEVRSRANPSCNHCYGTGKSGELIVSTGQPYRGKTKFDKELQKVMLTCKCAVRASFEKVPWLQRHGIDKQPWLKEEENESTEIKQTNEESETSITPGQNSSDES